MPRSALIFIFLFLPLQPETERRLLYNRKLSEEEIKNFRLMAAVGTGSKHTGNDGTPPGPEMQQRTDHGSQRIRMTIMVVI